jgi:hypothetical protein
VLTGNETGRQFAFMANQGMREDLIKALLIVWLISGTLTSLVMITPYLFPPDLLYAATPECVLKATYGKPCPLCGMSHAFVFLSKGMVDEALHANSSSLLLYLGFLLNSAGCFLFALVKAVKHSKTLHL